MDARELAEVCVKALSEDRYVYLSHRGTLRDVYPYEIVEGRLYCWCSLHSDRTVEGMYLANIDAAAVSNREIGMLFPFESEFSPEAEAMRKEAEKKEKTGSK